MTTLRDEQKALRDEADALEEAATAEEQQAALVTTLKEERRALEHRLSLARMQIGTTTTCLREGSSVQPSGEEIAAGTEADVQLVDAELERLASA